jgi:transcriptional regulator with XRE-family HTH domain
MNSGDDDLHHLRVLRLKELLEKLESQGISQRQAALRAGVPPQYLSDVKMGRRGLTELFARRLQQEFGVDHQWLLGDSPSTASARFGGGVSGLSSQRSLLPVFPQPIEGDPQAHRLWDGTAVEAVGASAAKAAAARQPYILRFGADDRRGRLRKNDLVLISQFVDDQAEVQVVKWAGKAFLARRDGPGTWEPLASQRSTCGEPTIIGHAVGIFWGIL